MPVQHSASAVKPAIDASMPQALQAVMAICLGIAIIGFVGFSHLEIVHNAAHDTRHANAFPCH